MNVGIKNFQLLYSFASQCAAIDVAQLTTAEVKVASQLLLNAHQQGLPSPVLSANGLVIADENMAYNIQMAFISALLLASPPQGFKAGLTTAVG